MTVVVSRRAFRRQRSDGKRRCLRCCSRPAAAAAAIAAGVKIPLCSAFGAFSVVGVSFILSKFRLSIYLFVVTFSLLFFLLFLPLFFARLFTVSASGVKTLLCSASDAFSAVVCVLPSFQVSS